MNLRHRIDSTKAKKLIGFSITTSFQDNKTALVWRQLMSRRKEIINRLSDRLISLQIYPENFTPDQSFTKYALAEVSDFEHIPTDFETFALEAGKYLVFSHQGKADKGSEIFSYIFQTFIPENNFEVDNRPHFEVFGEDYDPFDENSQEEIWIPIK